jgi:hypothetical protein
VFYKHLEAKNGGWFKHNTDGVARRPHLVR